jgi:uncharacterized protein (TIGR00369 family)
MVIANSRLERAREALGQQGFSTLLGTEIHAFDQESIDMRLQITSNLGQRRGFVHGGVISYLADNAMSFVGIAALGGSGVTSEMKINFISPAIGQLLIARATVLSAGRSQAVCRCEIYAVSEGVEKLCAAAQGTMVILSQPKSSSATQVD